MKERKNQGTDSHRQVGDHEEEWKKDEIYWHIPRDRLTIRMKNWQNH